MTAIVCSTGAELLIDYFEDALPTDLRADVEAHLAECPRCVAFVASYSATPHIVRRATAEDPPADLDRSLREYLRRRRN